MAIPWWRRNFLARRRLDQIFLDLPDAVMRRATGRSHWPPYSLRSFVGGALDFDDVGRALLGDLKELGLLGKGTRALDIGCGCGRLARPLATDKSSQDLEVAYTGVDVDRLSVQWCARHIVPLNPRFRFQHVNCHNLSYNPGGVQAASAYVFPYRDSSFDLILMTSVLTHLMVDDFVHYLSEVSRLIAPDGVAYVSLFLYRSLEESADQPNRHGVAFPFRRGNYAVNREDFPTNAIAYDEDFVQQTVHAVGMTLLGPTRYGAQDMLLLVKCPAVEEQPELRRGWHHLEKDRWRWTERVFEVGFRRMPSHCAKLRFRFLIPKNLLSETGEVVLSAVIGNQSMPVSRYATVGEHIYEHDIPAAALTTGGVTVRFQVAKPYRHLKDERELGVQVPFWTPFEQTLRRLYPISIF